MKSLNKFFVIIVAFLFLSQVACKKKDDDGDSAPSTPADVTSPVITLKGSAKMTLSRNGSFTDPGATATDDTDGDISSKIMVNSDLDSSAFGLYNIVYTVRDNAGNDAVPVVRNVEVVFGRDDYFGAYDVKMDASCNPAYQLNSPQSITAGSNADEIQFNGYFPVLGGVVLAKVDGRKVTIIPTTLQTFLNISGSGEIDEDGKVLVMNITIENTLPIVGGVESCKATYTKL